MSKIYLDVSYDQKNKAKKIGAQWDGAVKKWYFWQTSDTTLPEGLDQFFLPEGPVSETDYKNKISIKMKTIQNELPDAVVFLREALEKNRNKNNNNVLKQANDHIKSLSDQFFMDAALDLLAALVADKEENLRLFIKGKPSDNMKALQTYLGAPNETHRQSYLNIEKINGKSILAEVMRRESNTYILSEKTKAMGISIAAEVKKTSDIFTKIDPDTVDFDADVILIDGNTIELSFYNLDLVEIQAVNGKTQINLDDKEKTFCCWINKVPGCKELNSKLSERYKLKIKTESVKAKTFRLSKKDDAIKISGDDFTAKSSDGRIARGYIDEDEWIIYQVGGKLVDSCHVDIMNLTERIKKMGMSLNPFPKLKN